LSLRAVVFDYGMVLTGVPDLVAHDAMMRITALPADRFESLYWTDRHAYDEGKLTGIQFWQKLLRDAGLPEDQKTIEELNEWDARMWTTENPAMLDWQKRLKEHGLKTAILSNMGDNVLARIEREFNWIHRFDTLVWSFQLLMAKPDPAIYRYTLAKLGTQPEETLFLDDKQENIKAAQAMGMMAFQFSNVDQLRNDLLAAGLGDSLPLPS
jgi:putative hydrolase of the HAD superfamily